MGGHGQAFSAKPARRWVGQWGLVGEDVLGWILAPLNLVPFLLMTIVSTIANPKCPHHSAVTAAQPQPWPAQHSSQASLVSSRLIYSWCMTSKFMLTPRRPPTKPSLSAAPLPAYGRPDLKPYLDIETYGSPRYGAVIGRDDSASRQLGQG